MAQSRSSEELGTFWEFGRFFVLVLGRVFFCGFCWCCLFVSFFDRFCLGFWRCYVLKGKGVDWYLKGKEGTKVLLRLVVNC